MSPRRCALVVLPSAVFLLAACGSAPGPAGTGGHGIAGHGGTTSSLVGGTGGGDTQDAGPDTSAGGGGTGGGMMDAGPDADSGAVSVDTLASNRDRLLGTYLDYLK